MTTTGSTDGAFLEAVKAAWDRATVTEPATGKVTASDLGELSARVDALATLQAEGLEAIDSEDERTAMSGTLALVYARCAAVAIAGGDAASGDRWLSDAHGFAVDDDLRDELAAARLAPQRYRALVHGRNLIANEQEAAARRVWNELTKDKIDDLFTKAAREELAAPRPLADGQLPTLWSWNGVGLAFRGRRDQWPDGSYVTTHCFTAVYVPLVPLRAYRVQDAEDGYTVLAREQLSSFAKIARLAVAGLIVAAIAGFAIHDRLNDPERLARIRWDDALEVASGKDPEAGLSAVDRALASDDITRVSSARVERAGAEVVRLSASYVAKPFTRDSVDQASRVVRRYQALPSNAQGGAARVAILAALDGWIAELGATIENADARLALLHHAASVADRARAGEIAKKITTDRLALANARVVEWPLDALATLAGATDPATIELTTKIVTRLVESPSLLLDAGSDLDTWFKHTTDEPLRAKVVAQQAAAEAGRSQAEAEDVTAKQLGAMQIERPWDQHVAIALARDDASKGNLTGATARLAKLGAPGLIVRDARLLLGQLAMAEGRLEEADRMLASLLGSRLRAFETASAALRDATAKVEQRLRSQLDTDLPADLASKLESAGEVEQRGILLEWFNAALDADPAVKVARDAHTALGDVVPVVIAAGSVKLRRAQALSGGARDAMLGEAERAFLAVRAEAEGQPEFHLSLGEIYARLGKTKESEAEFAALLAKQDPDLTLEVANVYREIGSIERATQVAKQLYDTASSPIKERAAKLLGLFSARDEDESEAWYRKADSSDPFVRVGLLEIEAQRLRRQGKHAECAAKFAEVAKAYVAAASASDSAGYNNAAGAHGQRFACTGDVSALRDAAAMYEKAYRAEPDDPVVVGNLAKSLEAHAKVRVVAKRVDVRVLRLALGDANDIIEALLVSAERDAVLAELGADPGYRRSAELIAQFEILAPNNTAPYDMAFNQAYDRRDEVAAAAVVDRARRANALDLSDAAQGRAKWRSGASDAMLVETILADVARFDAALAQPRVTGKTRGAAYYLLARAIRWAAVVKPEPALLARVREAGDESLKLWPALEPTTTIMSALIDEAALAADAKTWIPMRREESAIGVLASLAEKNSPLAVQIRASKQWGEVARYARADTTRPGTDDVRVARLLGDAALLAKAQAVFDDKLVRLALELAIITSPKSDVTAQELAFLDKR